MTPPITRDQALELVKKYNSNERDLIHYKESEAIMREVADKLGEDVNYYGMLSLVHDIDWGLTKDNVETHLTKAPEILKEAGFDDKFIEIILSHGYGFEELPHLKDKKRSQKVHFALASCETLTGLIHAYALMRGKNITGMQLKGLKKKFKDKTFAAGCEREIIKEAENYMDFDEFLQCGIEGIKKIKDEVGLE